MLLGAPQILQSDNGSEFTAQVVKDLKSMWPELVMVHGKPRHPQSQGSVERANADIKDMLTAWLADNETTDCLRHAIRPGALVVRKSLGLEP